VPRKGKEKTKKTVMQKQNQEGTYIYMEGLKEL